MAADVSFNLSPAWSRPGWPPGNTPETRAALNRIGRSIVATAQRLAPISHEPGIAGGSLRSTIRHKVASDSRGVHVVIQAGGVMGSSRFVDYAAYVEAGTSRMAAQPYLRPAVDQAVGLARL